MLMASWLIGSCVLVNSLRWSRQILSYLTTIAVKINTFYYFRVLMRIGLGCVWCLIWIAAMAILFSAWTSDRLVLTSRTTFLFPLVISYT